MSEHEFINELREKCDLYELSFTNTYSHIEKLVETRNIKFFYITKESRPDDKALVLDILIITNNSVCIGYSLYKDGRSNSTKFLVNDIRSVEIKSDKKHITMEIMHSNLMRMGWATVDTKSNIEKMKRFHLNILSVWKIN